MYYQILNQLPHPPEDLLLATQEIVKKQDLEHYVANVGRTLSSNYKKYPRTALIPQLETWCKENITDTATEYALSVSIIEPGVDTLLPHTDRMRNYTLMYLLSGGGENHRTVFYKHINPNLIIERKQNYPYSDLIEVDSIVVPLRTWTLLNAQQIHSVENIPGMRLALQLSLEINPWQHLLQDI
jgi:hypothetical protein